MPTLRLVLIPLAALPAHEPEYNVCYRSHAYLRNTYFCLARLTTLLPRSPHAHRIALYILDFDLTTLTRILAYSPILPLPCYFDAFDRNPLSEDDTKQGAYRYW